MSSENDQDELEERKDEIWSMDEVRGGGGGASADTADAAMSEDTSDASEPGDEADSSDTSDTDGTINEESTSTESEVEDTPDTEAVSESSDSEDTSDTSVKDEERPVSQAEGETVRQMALDAEDKGLAVRDLHNVNVYLFESVYHDMRTKFKELDTEYYAAHGEDLSKNKDFFNAVFRAGLQSPQLKEELEIE